jgi:hypothetical protein
MRMNKSALADVCVVAAFMKRASRLPGQKALKKSIALAKRLARSCKSFINMNSFVEGNELSSSLHIDRVLDVTASFTQDRSSHAPRTEGNGLIVHSIISRQGALEQIGKLPVGAVGMLVGCSRADAFIRKDDAYDRISQTRTGEWLVRTNCDQQGIVDDDLEDSELIIFSEF